ncbi:prepilin-type N-terminal cleavage/methylation domain-containing protein [Pontiellaceae bacterium B1224]|nr:prepilin-type N-terminal cleavage/methylation domain-containing protein [Pontiellaceae bacterium B1224]
MPTGPTIHALKRGFTMIELLVVMAIIIVITSISIPTIDAMTSPKHALRKEGRKIMQLMAEARMMAMSRKVQVDLRIDPETRKVRMLETRAFQNQETGDSMFQSSETDTSLYEKVLVLDEEYSLESFTANDVVTANEDSVFQTLEEVPTLGNEEGTTDQLAVSFTHFGGSNGGGITLTVEEIQLHIAADILTGRPKMVKRRQDD